MSRHPFAKRLGRKPHWDPRNEQYLVEGSDRARTLAVPTAAPKRRTRKHYIHPGVMRQLDQGPTPQCTAYGSEMWARCLPLTQHHLPLPHVLYEQIQGIDRAEGRVYTDGATTLAAMKALQALGIIDKYEWTVEPEVAFNTLAFAQPIIAGTNWYPSMFERDAEGVIRIAPRQRPAGGHLYAINGLVVRPDSEDLLRIAQSWGDGYYYLPVGDFARLMYEDGEVAVPHEMKDAALAPGVGHA